MATKHPLLAKDGAARAVIEAARSLNRHDSRLITDETLRLKDILGTALAAYDAIEIPCN